MNDHSDQDRPLPLRLTFDHLAGTIEVPDDPDFLAGLSAAAAGWGFAVREDTAPPIATIRRDGDLYTLDSADREPVEASAIGAACGVIIDLVDAMLAQQRNRLCLHCGAVEIGGRLVLFPSHSHAGKSTLVSRLAADGHRVFCDDILPLAPDDDLSGMGLGVAPRLRLPLPAHAAPAFRDYVARNTVASDGRYAYLGLRPGQLAIHGETAPLGAVVLLDRREGVRATFGRASRADALKSLIVQNQGRSAGADEILSRLHRVMDRLPRLTLRYEDLEEAAGLIGATFASWPPRIGAGLPGFDDTPPVDPLRDDDTGRTAPPLPAGTRLVRKPGVALRGVDGDAFLAHPDGVAVHHLNAVGAGIWNLLDEPMAAAEATDLLAAAFPDADPRLIRADVDDLFAALDASGLALRVR